MEQGTDFSARDKDWQYMFFTRHKVWELADITMWFWPDNVMWHIGMQDIDGVDLYEQDIVEREGKLYEIFWNYEFLRYSLWGKDWTYDLVKWTKLKLKGNIYENEDFIFF